MTVHVYAALPHFYLCARLQPVLSPGLAKPDPQKMARSRLQRRAQLLQVFFIVQSGLGAAKAFAEAHRKVLLTAILIGVGETRKELLRLLFLCLELRNQLLPGSVPPLGYVLGVPAIRAARKNESGVHRLPGDDGA